MSFFMYYIILYYSSTVKYYISVIFKHCHSCLCLLNETFPFQSTKSQTRMCTFRAVPPFKEVEKKVDIAITSLKYLDLSVETTFPQSIL